MFSCGSAPCHKADHPDVRRRTACAACALPDPVAKRSLIDGSENPPPEPAGRRSPSIGQLAGRIVRPGCGARSAARGRPPQPRRVRRRCPARPRPRPVPAWRRRDARRSAGRRSGRSGHRWPSRRRRPRASRAMNGSRWPPSQRSPFWPRQSPFGLCTVDVAVVGEVGDRAVVAGHDEQRVVEDTACLQRCAQFADRPVDQAHAVGTIAQTGSAADECWRHVGPVRRRRRQVTQERTGPAASMNADRLAYERHVNSNSRRSRRPAGPGRCSVR